MSVIPAVKRWRQEDHKLDVRYIMRLCLSVNTCVRIYTHTHTISLNYKTDWKSFCGWVRLFAVKARGLEFKSPAPTYKPVKAVHACNPSVRRWRHTAPGSLLASWSMKWWVSGSVRELASNSKVRALEEDQPPLPATVSSSGLYMCTQGHTHSQMCA